MVKYTAYLDLAGERTRVTFETDIQPVEFLWQRYGMSTFIESVTLVAPSVEPAPNGEEDRLTPEERETARED
jgi:hypothetical protein